MVIILASSCYASLLLIRLLSVSALLFVWPSGTLFYKMAPTEFLLWDVSQSCELKHSDLLECRFDGLRISDVSKALVLNFQGVQKKILTLENEGTTISQNGGKQPETWRHNPKDMNFHLRVFVVCALLLVWRFIFIDSVVISAHRRAAVISFNLKSPPLHFMIK